MDTIELGTTGRRTTRLGYGCSSVGGAMGRKESLAMLEAAFDAGVRHFDVAPMYGFGQAESCLGEFLARHRADVTVTTKYGIPPAKNQGLLSIAKSVARPIARLLPGLKKGISQVAGKVTQPTVRASFTAAQAKESLDRSLAQLKTGHIDLWLLHEVESDDLRETGPELLRLLEDLVAAGTIGAFGVGSDIARLSTLLVKRPQFCRTVQFEWSVLDPPVPAMDAFRIHHRTLTDNFRTLHRQLTRDKLRCAQWSEAVAADLNDRTVLAALMLKAALVENPGSIILFSSKHPAHIRKNVEVAGDAKLEAPALRFYTLIQDAAKKAREIEAGG